RTLRPVHLRLEVAPAYSAGHCADTVATFRPHAKGTGPPLDGAAPPPIHRSSRQPSAPAKEVQLPEGVLDSLRPCPPDDVGEPVVPGRPGPLANFPPVSHKSKKDHASAVLMGRSNNETRASRPARRREVPRLQRPRPLSPGGRPGASLLPLHPCGAGAARGR